MNGVMSLAKRNFMCFFRDRSAVVFSLIAVLIVIMLYLFFLRNMLVDSYPSIDGMSKLIDAWVLSGIMGIVAVTCSAGSLQIMIDDKVTGKLRDLSMTSMSSYGISAGYVLSTFAVGMAMSLITLVLSVIYLFVTGAELSLISIVLAIILTIPSALSGSIIIYALVSFIGSPGAFSGMFAVVSVLIGFLTGIYMPMGTMSEGMQIVGTLVPASHMAMLFRNILCSDMLNSVFEGAPLDVLEKFRYEMGFDLHLGDFDFTYLTSIIYVIGVTVVFFVIAVVAMRRRS